MDVRLGVSFTTKELVVDLGDDTGVDDVRSQIDSAMENAEGMLWLTDRKGRSVGVPVARLGYVEIDSPEAAHRVGFGS